ncbi:putative membrane protein YdjX (TVP38/TMEM64 family) [Peribacillus deserti]|uniref:TVP38/TMEM64 family membrane protein n=1 Tax=Peribacillus deserti TaxID=673318 RepID=A0ABS2QLQ8_9BACI|nr:VTT domain-containing protein [Peribacillus deserti]MBM7694115.1 putative membrane protein YdjX (TVP38/TMEM64 family) [Peribacillus deserti]
MKEILVSWFKESGLFAYLISMLMNVLISILGVVPSVFLTAANITFFGFSQGLFLSIAGEALGAIISFYIYRKGIKRITITSGQILINKLQSTKGTEAFLLILALRIFPFVPSGAVTLAGAASKVSMLGFALASTMGKIPALIIEALTVKAVLQWDLKDKLILAFLSIGLAAAVFYYRRRSRNKTKSL